MNTIQDVLHDLPTRALEPEAPAEPRVYYDDRLWPAELLALLEGPKAVKLLIEGPPTCCPNCGGANLMFVFTWTAGPFRVPTGGSKVKWLESDGIAPGWYTGETHAAPCPVCQLDGWREYLRANCGLKGGETAISLEDFKIRGAFAEKEPAARAARSLLAANRAPHGFVTFWGEPGRGKTHLLKAVVNGFRGLGIMSRYTVAADLLSEIRDHFGDDRGGVAVEDAIRYYKRIRVLAVDELVQPAYSYTSWEAKTLFRLLDARYQEADQLLTVLAMQPDPGTLAGDLGYLASRMAGGVTVEVAGPDMRNMQGFRQRAMLEQEAGDDDD